MVELTSIRTKSIEKVRMNLTFSDGTKKAIVLSEGSIYKIVYLNTSTNVMSEFKGKLITIMEAPLYGFIQTHSGKTYNLLFEITDENISGQIWVTTVQLRDIDVIYTAPDDTNDGISEEAIREAVVAYLTENPIEDGVVPTFTIGTVTTLAAGSQATVSVTGTPANPVLNLGIPRGADGEDGATGATGPAGKDGTNGKDGATGATGATGSNGKDGKDGITPTFTIGTITTLAAGSEATATITGTAANPVLNLSIPKGATGAAGKDGTNGKDGATGPAGENGKDGTTPTFTIGTVTTLDTGEEVTVTITGTATNPVLNLGIPKGATGATGAAGKDGTNGKDGATGATGPAGENGKDGKDGVTPVRGTDYWTEADIAAMQEYCRTYIDEQIAAANAE